MRLVAPFDGFFRHPYQNALVSKNGTLKITEGTNEQSEVLDNWNEEGKWQMGCGRLLSESMTGQAKRRMTDVYKIFLEKRCLDQVLKTHWMW